MIIIEKMHCKGVKSLNDYSNIHKKKDCFYTKVLFAINSPVRWI